MKYKVFIIFALCWPMIIMAQKNEFKSGVYWEINNDVLIISGNGSMFYYKEYPWRYKNYAKVIIEDGITDVPRTAFEYAKMEAVEIGNSVKNIDGNAFYSCEMLRSVKFGNSVKIIGDWAFSGCKSLKSIVIPNSVSSIGDFAFEGCSSLQSVVLPSTITSIKNASFYKCKNLESVIPESMVSTWDSAFRESEFPKLTRKKLITGPDNTQYYIISKNKKYGLSTLDGKEIVAMEVDGLSEAGKGYLRFVINGYCGIMNYQGKVIIPTSRGYTSIGNYVSLTKHFPYTMDGYKGECDATGKQISKIKVEMPKQNTSVASSSSSSSSNSNSSSKSNSGNKTTTVVVEHHRDPIPVQEWQTCTNCWGEGIVMCQGACGGTGTYYVGNRLNLCSSCNGSGKKICPYCSGQGGKNVTVYR